MFSPEDQQLQLVEPDQDIDEEDDSFEAIEKPTTSQNLIITTNIRSSSQY